MHSEFYKEEHILLSQEAALGYETPGYLQENMNHAEEDEHEENRSKAAAQRRLAREIAIKRKKLLIQLMDREKKIREKIKELEEEERKKLTDDLRKKLEDELEKKKKELEELLQELEDELKRLAEEKMKQNRKKEARALNMEMILKEKERIGIRIKLERIHGFRSKYIIKVVYGLFLNSEGLYDDLGELMVYETARYNDPPKESKDKEGAKIDIPFKNEMREFVKNVQGLIYLNKSRDNKKILIGFRVIGIMPKKKAEIDEIKDIDDEDPLKDLPLPEEEKIAEELGWRFYDVTSLGSKLEDSSRSKSKSKKDKNKGKSQTLLMFKSPMLKMPYVERTIPESKVKLTFSFDTFHYDFDSLEMFADQRVKKEAEKKDKFVKVKKKKYDKIYKDAFIRNEIPQYSDIAFTKGSGIDLYIDGCRFLPDNVTVTKVPYCNQIIVRFVNSEMTDVLTAQGGRPELDSDIYNPVFNFRQELRAPNFDPTLMLCTLD